ncbi:MAG: hypothetical protein ABIJ97_06170, partial [Bacteroidota bacterium]
HTILILIVLNSYTFSQGFDINNINKTDNNGLKQGMWVFYDIDTLIKYSIGFKPKNDTSITKHENTHQRDTVICIKISKIGFYLNNKMDSIWRIYDELDKIIDFDSLNTSQKFGKLKYEVYMKNDSIKGVIKEYFPNENLKIEFVLKNNVIMGMIKCYHMNGKLKFSGIIQPNSAFFEGIEYDLSGRKLNERKFNTEFIKKEWIDIYNIVKRLKE